VPACARLARQAVLEGHSVVIGLQSTGESNTSAQREEGGDEMDDFVRRLRAPALPGWACLAGGWIEAAAAAQQPALRTDQLAAALGPLP
jgi:hypothetical protein